MRLKAIGNICVLVVGLLAGAAHVIAQQDVKVFRIGILATGSAATAKRNIDPFRAGLRELGYIEGKNLRIEYRYADREVDRLSELATELVRAKADVILVTGNRAARAAGRATSRIPIVVGGAGDLVGSGLVASLAHPGGNITGFTRMATELGAKRIGVLKETVTPVRHLAVVWSTRQDEDELKEMDDAARQLGVKLQPVHLKDPKDFQRAYSGMVSEGVDALIILHSGFAFSHRTQLIELAAKHGFPSMCETARWANNGCLMSYGPDLSHLYRRAAIYVDKILQGSKPANLPVQRPAKFELTVNLKTAKQLSITIPPSSCIVPIR